jgi:hypothetical protein
MRMYAVTFSAVAITVQSDLFEIVVPAAGLVHVHGLVLGQTTDHGDAAAEALQLLVVRGHTTSGSGGSSATPAPLNSDYAASGSTAEVNNTTIASAGTTVTLLADVWNTQAGYQSWWTPEARPRLRGSERLVVRQSAPADSITASGTIYFSEE